MIPIKIYDNFLEHSHLKNIQDELNKPSFPWFFLSDITGESKERDGYFAHTFYINASYASNWFQIVQPIIFKIKQDFNFKALLRAKANLYSRTDILVHHKDHSDEIFSNIGVLLYLNTNDGFTVINNEHKIESVENRLMIFDASVKHHSTNCTNAQHRLNINFNFL